MIVSRSGRLWCLLHRRWWKNCPCPGDVSTTVQITREVFEAVRPKRDAFMAYFTVGK